MNFSLHNIKLANKVNISNVMPKPGEITMENANRLDGFMKTLIEKIKNCATAAEADRMLHDLSTKSKDLEKLDYTMYKHSDYNIISCLQVFGEPVVKNLKTLEELKLKSVPELVTTLEKDNSLYIITRHRGTENGNLRQYSPHGLENITMDSKLAAYRDMQRLTKAGLVDDKNLRGANWFYTPENRIFLPNWLSLRQIRPDESAKNIIEQYYKLIFGQ